MIVHPLPSQHLQPALRQSVPIRSEVWGSWEKIASWVAQPRPLQKTATSPGQSRTNRQREVLWRKDGEAILGLAEKEGGSKQEGAEGPATGSIQESRNRPHPHCPSIHLGTLAVPGTPEGHSRGQELGRGAEGPGDYPGAFK